MVRILTSHSYGEDKIVTEKCLARSRYSYFLQILKTEMLCASGAAMGW